MRGGYKVDAVSVSKKRNVTLDDGGFSQQSLLERQRAPITIPLLLHLLTSLLGENVNYFHCPLLYLISSHSLNFELLLVFKYKNPTQFKIGISVPQMNVLNINEEEESWKSTRFSSPQAV